MHIPPSKMRSVDSKFGLTNYSLVRCKPGDQPLSSRSSDQAKHFVLSGVTRSLANLQTLTLVPLSLTQLTLEGIPMYGLISVLRVNLIIHVTVMPSSALLFYIQR